jgi:hypothetical protein
MQRRDTGTCAKPSAMHKNNVLDCWSAMSFASNGCKNDCSVNP